MRQSNWIGCLCHSIATKKVVLLLLGTAILLLGVSIAVPSSRSALFGWLKGEPFSHTRPISYWVARLGDPDEGDEAMSAIIELGERSVPFLLQELAELKSLLPGDDVLNDRTEALYRTLRMDEAANARKAGIARRYRAVEQALHAIPTRKLAPALADALQNDDVRVRSVAATALGKIGRA
jgi:hypothetical protein